MKVELFQPTVAGEARVLILIGVFSLGTGCLEGRTKLAKLDFFVRYPNYMRRAVEIREPTASILVGEEAETIESRMIRHRYGPWDPAYFSILGRLISKELVTPVSIKGGIGYKTTDRGNELMQTLVASEAWQPTYQSAVILRRHMNLSGSNLKKFIYQNFPEIGSMRIGTEI